MFCLHVHMQSHRLSRYIICSMAGRCLWTVAIICELRVHTNNALVVVCTHICLSHLFAYVFLFECQKLSVCLACFVKQMARILALYLNPCLA